MMFFVCFETGSSILASNMLSRWTATNNLSSRNTKDTCPFMTSAKYMIWISVAWFTDPLLFQELINKKQQGIIIEIALDDCKKNREAEFKLENEFPVYWITVQSHFKNIMHEKFCVIDLYTSIHGTFNWTKAANYNKEHISIDKSHATAAAFADEFMKLKNKKVWNS